MPYAALSGVPAATKIKIALFNILKESAHAEVNLFTDARREISKSEMPAWNISCRERVTLLGDCQHDIAYEALYDIDIYRSMYEQSESVPDDDFGTSDNYISDEHEKDISIILRALHQNYLIGGWLNGLAEDVSEVSVNAEPDDVPDIGCTVLTLKVRYRTPFGDAVTINSASGPIV